MDAQGIWLEIQENSPLKLMNGWFVTLRDNIQCKIIDIGKIGKDSYFIDKVSLVDGFKHNLLNISQLCDQGFKVIFELSHCIVQDSKQIRYHRIG